MRLAIISDPHCGQPRRFFARLTGRHDRRNGRRLLAIVDGLNDHRETFRLVVLGDLTDRGTIREYKEARAALSRYRGPVVVVPGNHDVTSPARLGMGFSRSAYDRFMLHSYSLMGATPPCAMECEGYRLLLLDSSAHNEKGTLFARGRIGHEQLAWLASELADPRPTVVAMHHYPERVNPTLAVEDADELMRVCARDHVTIINGHRHLEGEYQRKKNRPRILTHGQCVETGRVRVFDPFSGQCHWLQISL